MSFSKWIEKKLYGLCTVGVYGIFTFTICNACWKITTPFYHLYVKHNFQMQNILWCILPFILVQDQVFVFIVAFLYNIPQILCNLHREIVECYAIFGIESCSIFMQWIFMQWIAAVVIHVPEQVRCNLIYQEATLVLNSNILCILHWKSSL